MAWMRGWVAAAFALAAISLSAQQSRESAWAREFVRGRSGIRSTTPRLATGSSLIEGFPRAGILATPWQPVGPMQVETAAYGKVTGRVTSIAIDPTDASGNTVYIGTTGGGVWKSTNAAGDAASAHFAPLTDTLSVFTSGVPSLSIGAVSVSSTGVVLAGTGDPNDATDSYYGEGILRSTDGGATWSLIATSTDNHSFVGEGFAGFAWSTLSPNLVIAAVSHSTEGTLAGASVAGKSVRGLYYSNDGGATWTMATLMDGSATVQGPGTNYSAYEGNAVTSVVWNPRRQRFYAAVRYRGYYESADGRTWTRMTNQPGAGLTSANCPSRPGLAGAQSCPIFRGALAAQPVTGDLFALSVDLNNNDTGLYQDACAWSGSACVSNTVQWAKQWNATAMETAGAISQGDYNLALAAVPWSGDTLLFAGTTEIFRCSIANGCTLRNTTNATTGCAGGARVAPAQHAMAWMGSAIYFGNDGGLWRSLDGVNQSGTSCSTDDATHFQNLNGALGSLAEVHAVSSHPSDADTLLVALGTHGTAATTAGSALDAWTQMSTGESGNVSIDASDPRNWFVQSGAGVSIVSCANGKSCTPTDFIAPPRIGATQVSGDDSLASPPFLLDPAMHTNMIVGTCRVWRGDTAGGAMWSPSNAISTPLAGPMGSVCDATNAFVHSLAAGGTAVTAASAQNAGSPVLYAGTAGALNGGTTYGGHVFSTTSANTADGSTVWTDRALYNVTNDTANAGLFNPGHFDISSLYADPHDETGNTVYATVMGFGYPHLYRSIDAGATWTNVSSNLPNAPANAVVVDPVDPNTIYVATDAGVYVTTAITTCTTTNCWGVYGSGLPNAPVVALEMQAGVAARGSSQNGVLRAATYGRGVWEIPLLTAGSVTLPTAVLSPSSLTFASQNVTSTSAAQTITVANTGSAALAVLRMDMSGDFAATTDCTTASVAVNATCSLHVTFTPTAVGTRTGSIVLTMNTVSGSATINLTGAGAGIFTPALSQTALSFADTRIQTTSAALTLKITNTGLAGGAIGAPVVTGDYAISSTTCGTSLSASGSCDISVVFKPTVLGTRSGTLTISSDAGPLTVALSGNGTGVFTPSLAQLSLAFPSTQINEASAAQNVTITNSGTMSGVVGTPIVTGDFTVASNGCGATLAAGASCSISLIFKPSAVGTRTGSFSITSDAGPLNVALAGTGSGTFVASLSPTSLNFPNTTLNATGVTQNILVVNSGTISGSIGSFAVTGDFLITANTCGATLAPNTSCPITIAFKPTAAGARTGTLSVTSDSGPLTATLSGTGTTVATDTLSVTSLSFPSILLNTTSAAQTITMRNDGDVALTLISANILSGDFAVTNGCGVTLAAHATCQMQVTFTPRSVGAQSGALSVRDALGTQTVTLTGTGIAPAGISLTPASITFGTVGVGIASASQAVTLTNNGGSPLTISNIGVTGDFGLVNGSSTCSTTAPFAAGKSCQMVVAFIPQTAGARSGALTLASNASNSPQTIMLSGTGVDFTLAASGATTHSITSGATATFNALLTPAVTMPQSVALTCTGAPANSKCDITPTSTDLTGPQTLTVRLTTGTSAHAIRTPAAIALGFLLAFGLAFRRKTRIATLLGVMLVVTGVNGCGSGRQLPANYFDGTGSGGGGGSTTPVTPAGTYPIVVTATAADLSRAVTFNVVVQ